MRRMGGERTGATYEENPQQKAEAELQEVFRSFERPEDDRRAIVPAYEAMGLGDMTPIPHIIFDELPNNRILMSYDCAERMNIMLDVTREKGVEVPFVLIGEQAKKTNYVMFNEFYSVKNNSGLTWNECDFEKVTDANVGLVGSFKKRIEAVAKMHDGSRAIICFGHTHPAKGDYYGTYSRGDLRNLIQYDDSIAKVKREMKDDDNIPAEVKREMEDNSPQTLSCVIMANGDMDFLFYDHGRKNFYKFTNVLRMNDDGNKEMLQNYTFITPPPQQYR